MPSACSLPLPLCVIKRQTSPCPEGLSLFHDSDQPVLSFVLVEIWEMEAAYGTLLIHGGQGEIMILTYNLNLNMKDINIKDKNK